MKTARRFFLVVFWATANVTLLLAQWVQTNGPNGRTVYSFAVSGTNLFAGTYEGAFLSTNNGTSWTAVNTGLTNTRVWALAVSGTNLYAGTIGGGVWRRPLSELVTGIEDIRNEIPIRFVLEQNYPNPFNPSTTITFSLSQKSFVSLIVFDLIGREVETLVKQELSAGNYTRKWNANKLPSGVYFYRLQTTNFTETKKLVLMK